MSPSVQLSSEQLKLIILDEKMTDQCAREVQYQVDGEEVIDPDNTSSVLSIFLNTINNKFEQDCLDGSVRLLTAHLVWQSTDDCLPGHKLSIPGIPGTTFLVHQGYVFRFIVRSGIRDADMPGALVADETGLGKTFTSLAEAMISKLLTEEAVMGWPLLILWVNTLAEWVNMVQSDFPGIISEEWEWYAWRRHNLVPHRLIEIQKNPPQGNPVLISALEPIMVVTLPGVAETFMSVIDEMTYATCFKLIFLLHMDIGNLTHNNLTTRLDEPDNRWNIHFDSYATLTSRAKPSSDGQHSHCLWSFGIFDESYQYKTKNSVGWWIAMNARIWFKHQVTGMPGFNSLY